MEVFYGAIVAGLPLCVVEFFTRQFRIAPEVSRKLVHVLSCIAVLLLPLWLSLRQISFIAAVFCILLSMSRVMRLWRSLYRVQRQSWGEVAFAVGVLVTSLLATSTAVFIASVAILGFADTAAALAGKRYGRHKIAFTHKSVEGCAAFFIISLTILLMLGFPPPTALISAALATIVELGSPYGLDNLTIPAVAVVLLNSV